MPIRHFYQRLSIGSRILCLKKCVVIESADDLVDDMCETLLKAKTLRGRIPRLDGSQPQG